MTKELSGDKSRSALRAVILMALNCKPGESWLFDDPEIGEMQKSDFAAQVADAFERLSEARTAVEQRSSQFTAMAWGDRIADEQLDELLARVEKAKPQTVLLRVDQFRDLVRQAKATAAPSAGGQR